MALLTVRHLYKSFRPDQPVLQDISLAVGQGEILCLLGPSGCGKTTLLRILAGIEHADAGTIWLDDREIQTLPAHMRRIGFMFQDHVLFPHRNVEANIAYGLHMLRWPRAEIRNRVRDMLNLVHLPGCGQRRVQELSGGESQRVALARSLAPRPRLLLLDEPLSSLDRRLRDELVKELRALLHALAITAVYVTHDQEEAFAIADHMALMVQGRLIRHDTPQAIYQHPGSVAAARFLRMRNIFPAGPRDMALLPAWLHAAQAVSPPEQDRAHVLIRPDALWIRAPGPDTESIAIKARVTAMTFRGGHYEVQVEVLDTQDRTWPLSLDMPLAEADPDLCARLLQAEGQDDLVSLALKPDRIQWLST